MLKKIGFGKCIHLTAARGIINDELALLSCASEVICLNNNWKYLKKLFGKRMDSYYDEVIYYDTINEHLRHVQIMGHILDKKINPDSVINIKETTENAAITKLNSLWAGYDSKHIVAIAPMSDELLRNWDNKNYIQLCQQIIRNHKHSIVLLGTQSQREKIDEIAKFDEKRIFNASGYFSVLESAAIVKHSDLFIGNDSGFTHIAKALNKKFIAIIGGGSYNMFFPYNEKENDNLFFHKMDCFSCEWKCIYDKAYCVQNVTVQQVYSRTAELLKNIKS
jgi:heptosyltransferase-2